MTKNKPVRKKLLSRTPIVIKLNPIEQAAIKQPPRISLERFKSHKADATDWYNIAFRIRMGLEVAKQEYVQQTVDDIAEMFNLWLVVFTNAKQTTGPNWVVENNTLEDIESTLDAIDTMQDETTRRAQLSAHVVAKKILNKYIKEFDEYLKSLNQNV